MKLYIAGGMSGIADLNFPLFHATAKRLRAEGHEVVNPAELCPHPHATWLDCMRTDIRELVTCEGIYLLPGWGLSKGARLEHHIASTLGLVVLLELPVNEVA